MNGILLYHKKIAYNDQIIFTVIILYLDRLILHELHEQLT